MSHDTLQQLQHTASNMGETLQFSPRQSQARLGPTSRTSMALASIAQNQSSIYRSSPTLTGTDNPNVIYTGRRTSMHDAALDVLQSTYPQIAEPQHPPDLAAAVRAGMKNRRVPLGKGKGKARADTFIYRPDHPAHTRVQDEEQSAPVGFQYKPGIGYVCIVCGVACPNTGLHRSMADGSGCVDFRGGVQPFQTQASLPAHWHLQPQQTENLDFMRAQEMGLFGGGGWVQPGDGMGPLPPPPTRAHGSVQMAGEIGAPLTLHDSLQTRHPSSTAMANTDLMGMDAEGRRLSQGAGLFF